MTTGPAASTLPIVDGATRLFCIIGDPIAQVKSPEEITARFRARGANALCVPIHASIDQFDAVVRGIKATGNYGGFILTVPHKVRAMPYVDRGSARMRRVGAVNVARRAADGQWEGDATDGLGLVAAVRQTGFDPAGARVMVVGAGGAGSAIIDALAEAGAASIAVADVDAGKAETIATRLAREHAGCRISAGAARVEDVDLLVNATPIGMAPGDGMPAAFGRFESRLVVADVITRPEVTPLLAHARACGCRTSTGVQMYKAQADMLTAFLLSEDAHRS